MLTLELWHNLLHLLDDSHIIEGLGDLVEFYLVLEGEVVRIFTHLGNHDLWMVGWFGVFLGGKEFLVEFLAIAKTSVNDLYIFGAREGYHESGEIDNFSSRRCR